MNISFSSLLKKRKKGQPRLYDHEFHVYRDWSVVMFAVLAAIVCSAAVHAYLFFKVSTGTLFSFTPTERPVAATVDRDKLKRTIESMRERQAEMEAVQSGATVLPKEPL